MLQVQEQCTDSGLPPGTDPLGLMPGLRARDERLPCMSAAAHQLCRCQRSAAHSLGHMAEPVS